MRHPCWMDPWTTKAFLKTSWVWEQPLSSRIWTVPIRKYTVIPLSRQVEINIFAQLDLWSPITHTGNLAPPLHLQSILATIIRAIYEE
jgi:hypothetical protein